MYGVYKMIKLKLKILQEMLYKFEGVFEHFIYTRNDRPKLLISQQAAYQSLYQFQIQKNTERRGLIFESAP